MCKDRIENTSKKAGASKAEWDAETLTLKLEFDQSKTSLDQILKKIAEVGHDNEKQNKRFTINFLLLSL
jgi:L-serine deaminase